MAPSPADRGSYNTSPSTLAGTGQQQADPDSTAAAPPPSTGPGNASDGLKAATEQMRSLMTAMADLAKQFPAASRSLKAATVNLRSAMREIVAQPGAPEPTTPAVGG
jgi:hypothetical protein